MPPQPGSSQHRKSKLDDPRMTCLTKIRFLVCAVFIFADLASVIALGPCISEIQRKIFISTTDCEQAGDCDSRAAKYNGMSGSVRGFGGVLLAAPYGVLADKYGRKPMLVLATLIPLLTLPLLLGSPSSIIPFYIVNGLVGFLPRAASVESIMVIDLTTPETRFQALSAFSMGTMLVALFATSIGSAIVNLVGEQGLLQCSVAMTTIEFFVLIFVLPETAHFNTAEEKPQQKDTSVHDKPHLRRQTSMNVADVLINSRDLDEDHRWEFKAFWLYLLCSAPDAMADVTFPFMLHSLYNFDTAEYGALLSVSMFYSFFWLSVGAAVLERVLSEKGRMLQAVVGLAIFGDLWLLFGSAHWVPMVASFLAGASALVPLLIKTLISSVNAEHRQGKVMGFLNACDALCGVVAPSLGGASFAFAQNIGIPRLPWCFNIVFLKPLAICMASYTLLPECMPITLQKRAMSAKNTGPMTEKWVGI